MHTVEKGIKERIFVVGCPRSGTTLLQSMIAAHPQVASFPETHFLVATGRTRRGRWCTRLGLASPEMRQRLDQFLVEIEHGEMRSLLPRSGWLTGQYADALVQILDRLTLDQGKTFWLEKTPGHLHYVKPLQRHIPEARFIHIVRNGADVVASLYQVTHEYPQDWGGVYDIDHCINRWSRDIQLTQQYVRMANHTAVRYEHLVENPQAVLKMVCDFVGLAFNRDMTTRYNLVTEKVSLPREVWKHRNSQATSSECTRFESVFDQQQRTYILERLVPIDL